MPDDQDLTDDNGLVSVTLSAFEWHLVVDELNHNLRFVNRDTTQCKRMLERICTQLNTGNPVKYQ